MLCRIYMAQPAKYARHETSCWEFSSLHVHPVRWWFNNKNKTDLQPYGFGMCISEHLLQTSKKSSVPYCAPLLERLSNQATGKAEGSWYWPCTCRRWASRQYGALCQVWCIHHIMLYSHFIHNPFCTCTEESSWQQPCNGVHGFSAVHELPCWMWHCNNHLYLRPSHPDCSLLQDSPQTHHTIL